MIAQYIEIDHNPYVLELVYPLGGALFNGKHTHHRLIQRLMQYDQELYTDTLTGAYNRRYLEERIKEDCPAGGVAVIDIDDFKLYNDIYGHDVGDIVLKWIVQTIKSSIRKNDYLIRYGGDEFILIMPYIAEQDLEYKLDAIKKKVRAIQFKEHEHLHVSISVGGVIYNGKHLEESLRQADKLMYQAKLHKDADLDTDVSLEQKEDTLRQYSDRKDIRPLIVIADDSKANRTELKAHLGETYRILEAKNGKDVLQLLQKYSTTIALILLDLVMPKMDGEVLAYMKDHRWYKNILVMMILDGNTLRKYDELII